MKTIIINENSVGRRQVPDICPVLLIGNFDGVHKGHQSLIKKAKHLAKQINTSLAVMSFNPHPGYFFQKECPSFSIVSEQQKLCLLEKHGVDYFYNVDFDKFTANTLADDFIKNFLYKAIKPSHIIIGENFRFGHKRQGDIKLLKEIGSNYSIKVHAADLIKDRNDIVSSSLIRQALKQGDIKRANHLLGWDWFIKLAIDKTQSTINEDICIIANPIDKRIISIKADEYNASIKLAENSEILVFSLHGIKNSIKLFLQERQSEHIFVVGDVIHLYPKNIHSAK